MSLILRLLMFLAAPIAALFVARDSLNFDIVQTMIMMLLVIAVLCAVAIWPRRNKKPP
ncbi:MAG: hypothetical protein ACRC9K_00370 [Afipia sp.]